MRFLGHNAQVMKIPGQCQISQENKCNSMNYYLKNGKPENFIMPFFIKMCGVWTSDYCV